MHSKKRVYNILNCLLLLHFAFQHETTQVSFYIFEYKIAKWHLKNTIFVLAHLHSASGVVLINCEK